MAKDSAANAHIRFKLPAEFMSLHGDMVRDWDWRRFPTLALKEVLPDVAALKDVRLELAADGAEQIVRPLGPGSAVRLRKYNDGLPQFPKPTREEIAAVLAKRNKPPDDQRDEQA
jgi:hypothetical protein